MTSFKLTEQSIEELPDEISEKLKALKDQEPNTKGKFLEAVEQKIGKDQTIRFQELILKHAEKVEAEVVTLCEPVENHHDDNGDHHNDNGEPPD